MDVYPENVTEFTVTSLKLDTEYQFNVIALNEKGESPPSVDIVQAKTQSKFIRIFFIELDKQEI